LSNDSLLSHTKKLLRHANLRARKGLGQHFLIDELVLQSIITAANLNNEDVVVEVGPGLGILTEELARHAGRVFGVEMDDNLSNILKNKFASSDKVTIINDNILHLDPTHILQPDASLESAIIRYKVVANLPYYITAPVLRHFLEASLKPKMMLVMVQKEVAETITAKPGQRSVLSISVQYYGSAKIIHEVPASAFYPAPKVDSAILRIDIYDRPAVSVSSTEGFFKLVRAGFTASRKQIANSLAQGLGLPKTEVSCLLDSAAISHQRRAETLTLEEWAQLWEVFHHSGEVK